MSRGKNMEIISSKSQKKRYRERAATMMTHICPPPPGLCGPKVQKDGAKKIRTIHTVSTSLVVSSRKVPYLLYSLFASSLDFTSQAFLKRRKEKGGREKGEKEAGDAGRGGRRRLGSFTPLGCFVCFVFVCWQCLTDPRGISTLSLPCLVDSFLFSRCLFPTVQSSYSQHYGSILFPLHDLNLSLGVVPEVYGKAKG